MAGELSRTGPVYAYEFNDRSAPAPEVMRTLPFPVGASHSLELRYLFDVGGAPPLDPAQQRLSDQMIDYWSAFVRTGERQSTVNRTGPTTVTAECRCRPTAVASTMATQMSINARSGLG